MDSLPISDYAMLSDCHSAALVSSHGSMDWLCFPSFDSDSVLGRLLDKNAGHWSITVPDAFSVSRRYLEDSLILETTFETETGIAVLSDAMAVGSSERGHDLGRGSPHCLLRTVACTRGAVRIEVEYVPRPEYGSVLPLLKRVDGGIESRSGASLLFLSCPIPMEISETQAACQFQLAKSQTANFALQHYSTADSAPAPWSQAQIADRLADSLEAWRSWSRLHQNYTGPWKEMVAHSGRVLQGLTYYPTGAIVAAPTTSLPESIGGDRNWDYRFVWVRDASFTLEALWVAACPDEAQKFFGFLTEVALARLREGADLQIMFGIRGEHDLTERVLPHLSGWRNSSPVRVGNGAWNQRQLDVYGELMGAVYLLREKLPALEVFIREFLIGIVDGAAARWDHKDQGIWEIRGEPQHFLYSKLMCWVALDRGIRLAETLDARDKVAKWTEVREQIRTAILSQGWSTKANSFSQSFGSDELDASALMLPIVGFLPADDLRVISTIDAIAERLTDQHGLVFRYRANDGLSGEEGSFLMCTFWLAQAQALANRLEEARATFSRAASFANNVGLMAEEVLPETRELLGNFPQAFSHIGLVNAAWAISQREELRKMELPVRDSSVPS